MSWFLLEGAEILRVVLELTILGLIILQIRQFGRKAREKYR